MSTWDGVHQPPPSPYAIGAAVNAMSNAQHGLAAGSAVGGGDDVAMPVEQQASDSLIGGPDPIGGSYPPVLGQPGFNVNNPFASPNAQAGADEY